MNFSYKNKGIFFPVFRVALLSKPFITWEYIAGKGKGSKLQESTK